MAHSTWEVCEATSQTSSFAVAERPCNALCLSVVSFNSTIHRAQSSVISSAVKLCERINALTN